MNDVTYSHLRGLPSPSPSHLEHLKILATSFTPYLVRYLLNDLPVLAVVKV